MSPRIDRQALGHEGEDLAARHLEAKGYRIVARRYRTRRGEIDLVASRGALLAFVEVKLRRTGRFGAPEESVPRLKQVRMARAAAHFLAARGGAVPTCRFDVIAISWPEGASPRIAHYEDAFRIEA